ncbi:hypothetical protein [Parabacteroides sp. PF5-6]|uniref:hypothetical protein n=1 Tax=Parabacteroides sp. PF5-6 TaxID=1742403 RepID=UPI00240709CE|nr:hypothetical protein [Parabacteroides sp. PF5-6]MDF9830268.1 hypothetical protein [Parabacteroides sp. PF5-6]
MTTVIIDETKKEGQEILRFLQKLSCVKILETPEPPCQMNAEELRNSVDRGFRQYQNGQTISHEEFLKKHERGL